jgi:hypothetical protein
VKLVWVKLLTSIKGGEAVEQAMIPFVAVGVVARIGGRHGYCKGCWEVEPEVVLVRKRCQFTLQ